MTDTKPTYTLAELEQLEIADHLTRCPAHRRVLARLRDEHAFDAELARERAIIDAERAEERRRAALKTVVLPDDGTDDDALVVSLRGEMLATEERDGQRVEHRLAGAVGFFPAAPWSRVRDQVLETLRRAHSTRAGEPSHFIVAEPGAPRADLLALIAPGSEPCLMHRSTWIANVARSLPLTRTVARWLATAEGSPDPDAVSFCRILRRRFIGAQLGSLLEPARSTREAPAPIDLSFAASGE